MKFSDLVSKESLTPKERRELRKLAWRLESITHDVGNYIGGGGRISSSIRAGNMVISPTQPIEIFNNDGDPTIRLERDGNAYFGADLRLTSDTALSIFSVATTYNSENFGAGDIMLGDNDTSKANLLWDKSAGTLKFRSGTTTEAYIDTTGAITAGAGAVRIDSDGINLDHSDSAYAGLPATSAVTWGSDTGDVFGVFSHEVSSTQHAMYLMARDESTNHAAQIYIYCQTADNNPKIAITASDTDDSSSMAFTGADPYSFDNGDFRIGSTDYTNMLLMDYDANKLDIGTATQGAIASFSNTGVVINEDYQDRDFTIRSDTNNKLFFLDGGNEWIELRDDAVGIKYPLRLVNAISLLQAPNDGIGLKFVGFDSEDNRTDYGIITVCYTSVTDGSETGEMRFYTQNAGDQYALKLSSAEIAINEDSNDIDFRVESDGNTHALFVDGGNNRVGILNDSPSEALDVTGNIAVSGTVDGIDIATDVAANTTHRTSDGTDHTYIDQDLQTTASPTFAGASFTDVIGVAATGNSTLEVADDGTNTAPAVLTLQHSTSETALDNFGLGILGSLENDAGDQETAMQLLCRWADVTEDTEDAKLIFNLMKNSSLTTILTMFISELRSTVPIKIAEAAAATGDTAGYGQLWVKNTDPCELWFTDDAGTDTQIV